MSGVSTALAALLGLLLAVSTWNALAAPRLRPRRSPAAPATLRASLLIPARNEAVPLARTLRSALSHAAALEILVLDDESTDGTAGIVRAAQWESGGRVRLHAGLPLPAGWVGKNWACHQLAAAAHGDILVFCDADVVLDADAVAATVEVMERTGSDVLTALPRQEYAGWWDRAAVPLLLHFPLLGTLPLPLVSRVRASSVVFGNGQWLAFRREAYQRIGGHAAVRGAVVEDMALVRRAKQLGLRVLPALAADALTVRMYRRPRDLFAGFAKNLYPLLGASPVAAGATLLAFAVVTLLPFALAARGAWLPLVLLAGVRVIQARTTRAPLATVLLQPIGVALACAALVHSAISHLSGSVTWKSRPLASHPRAPANG